MFERGIHWVTLMRASVKIKSLFCIKVLFFIIFCKIFSGVNVDSYSIYFGHISFITVLVPEVVGKMYCFRVFSQYSRLPFNSVCYLSFLKLSVLHWWQDIDDIKLHICEGKYTTRIVYVAKFLEICGER